MDGLTIHQAAELTGWSSRMLRYLERGGLVDPERSPAGYRMFGPGELQRLRTLRELLENHECGLSDVAFAARMRRDTELQSALDDWLESEPERPQGVSSEDWLDWEQRKHEALLAAT